MLVLVLSLLATAGCGDDDEVARSTTTEASELTGDRCLVRVHGRGETGAEAIERDGLVELAPTGNAEAGGRHLWLYDGAEERADARDRVLAAVDAAGCEDGVVLNGFSNGAAFVAALVCDGEDLGGRLRGAVIDDPVPDEGVVGCGAADGVELAVYWTGALDADAVPGRACEDAGWICAGETIIGIESYAAELGVAVQESPFDDHTWFRDAPEIASWRDERAP